MTHIVHVITGLRYGGAEKLLFLTCKYMISYRVKIQIVYFDPEAPMRPFFEQLGIPCKQVPRTLGGMTILIKLFRDQRIHVIHTHLIHADVLGRIAVWVSGSRARVFTTVHGTEWFRRENRIFPFLVRLADRLLSCPQNNSIIAISQSVRELLIQKENIKRQKITLLYNAVEVPPESTRIPSSSNNILYIGRLSAEKDIPTLISAIGKLKNLPVTLSIVGEGEERKRLEQFAEQLHIRDNVRFLGARSDVAPLYNEHDVLVLPSKNEGLGIVILEAFSQMLPVIGSNVEGILELLSNGRGVLFECGNSDDLAEKVVHLLRNKELQKSLAQAGYAYVRKHHDIQKYVATLYNIYFDPAAAK